MVATVSIHAPRFREAMRRRIRRTCSIHQFQSTPPVSGRRCYREDEKRHSPRSFQSTPPVSGRRCVTQHLPGRGIDVSIHAPRFREAMPEGVRRNRLSVLFQSTPPVSGRRCIKSVPADVAGIFVSIHAPRFREAMRRGCSTRLSQRCRFNPRPPFPGGDAGSLLIDAP